LEIQDIISSGLLELYAAGIASESETRQVEEWVALYPEVAAELKEIESGMESYANMNAIQPSSDVKEKIFARINTGKEEGKIITMQPAADTTGKLIMQYPYWKMVAAASIVLLVASIALNVATYNRYKQANKNLFAAKEILDSMGEKNKAMEEDMQVVQNKYSVPVSLKGLDAAPNAAAKIFWMQNTGEVFIDPSNLPDAPEGKQYQLWAIVDGKPVDGGMILTSKKGDRYRIQKMKTFGKAEAFAVTLETEKGNPTPKGPMYVMGKM
jgi:anti-sigma-K factor RskA